jgi:tRNA-splicing ligase RtcB
LIAQNAIDDMNAIMRLPFVIGGALMPDGHRVKENHVPVGGVVVADAVAPSIVGSDIACSVLLTVTDMTVDKVWFDVNLPSLRYTLSNYSYFGNEVNKFDAGIHQPFYLNPPSMETIVGRETLDSCMKEVRTSFGTSGDGNHFVEFGMVNISTDIDFSPKFSLAILSHFGSRVIGARIARTFEKLALDRYNMPKGMTDAPLSLESPEGRDYWRLMEWAGEFAEYGHRWLHESLLQELSKRVTLDYRTKNSIYSRHNFAWETPDGIVHRKGATPAAYMQRGVIPATMGDNTQIVVGLGNTESFSSASHGAGRVLSRGQAFQQLTDAAGYVHKKGIELIGGDADEHPLAYKPIQDVMDAQSENVYPVGQFVPRVVRMAAPRFMYRR